MPFNIYPEDNEWASATGSNVYSGGSTSQFDYPPIAMYDMVLTPDPSDPEPREFNIGDTVDISYKVAGFDVSLDDAVVVRSDLAPDGGGVVVFEGTNNFGQIEHLVWTPGFDLESWYWDHFSNGQPPGFWVVDTDPGYAHSYVCFTADTLIATATGPHPAGALRVGDRVETRDNGTIPIRWVARRDMIGVGRAAPIVFGQGARRKSVVRLSQQHRVFLRSARADELFGKPEVLVPAKAMVDGERVRYAAQARVTYIHLLFDQHVLVSANGLWCESLLLGPVAHDLIDIHDVPPELRGDRSRIPARPALSFREAAAIMPHPVPGAQKRYNALL